MTKKTKKSMFNNHAFVTLMTAYSFIVMAISGLVLLFVSRSWSYLTLTKGDFYRAHVIFGLLFIALGLGHAWTNRKALFSYFQKRKVAITTLFANRRLEWMVALVLATILFLLVKENVYPVSAIMSWLH